MNGEIEKPEDMAGSVYPMASMGLEPDALLARAYTDGILADRKQIAAWCIDRAEAAEREVGSRGAASYRGQRCEGQASALRALAAILGASR